jgi:hypothetical protein
MRKFLIPLLMASTMLPAAAYAEPGDRGIRAHGERSESNDNSSQSRPQRIHVERSNSDAPRVHVDRSVHADRSVQVERHVDVQTSEPTRVRRSERHQDAQPAQPVTEPVQQVQQVRRGNRHNDRNDGFVGAIRQVGEDARDGVVVHRGDGNHDGDHRWDGDRDGRHRWDRDWRRNSRYDWYSYRNRYGSLFRLGRYYDPYGWNYRRFSIGFDLWPSYYGSNYWLNDPWQYRLPPAYGPYRWVRYYDDALLVNIYTGQVVDVIYNVFW